MPLKLKISEILKHNPMSGRGGGGAGDVTVSEQVAGPTLFKLSLLMKLSLILLGTVKGFLLCF